jgi:hypothetical protein
MEKKLRLRNSFIGIVDKIKEKHLEVIFGNTLIKVEREKLRFLK